MTGVFGSSGIAGPGGALIILMWTRDGRIMGDEKLYGWKESRMSNCIMAYIAPMIARPSRVRRCRLVYVHLKPVKAARQGPRRAAKI